MKNRLKRAARRDVRKPQHFLHYMRLVQALLALALAAAPGVDARAESAFERSVEARVHALVNEVRARHGLHALERDARLDGVAENFGRHMALTQTLEHDADGLTPAARAKRRGYAYCVLSENIAFEFSTRGFTPEGLARNFVTGWLGSPAHRANILSGRVSQTGIGVARNGSGEYYAAQLFAMPAIPGARKGAACPRR